MPTPTPLPTLPVWQARSTIAQALLIGSVAANALGIDILGAAKEIGLGETPDQIAETGISIYQTVAPVAFGLWAWLERRAPSYQLVWPWSTRGGQPAAVSPPPATYGGRCAATDITTSTYTPWNPALLDPTGYTAGAPGLRGDEDRASSDHSGHS